MRGLVADMTDPVCAAWVTAFLRHLAGRGRAAVGGARRPGPAAELAAHRCRLRGGGRRGGADRARRGGRADAGAGAGRGGARRPGGDGDRQPHPLRPQRAEVLSAGGGDHQGRRGGDRRCAARARRAAGGRCRSRSTSRRTMSARCVDFFAAGSLGGLRVGVYQHSAAGRDLLVSALARLGAEVVPLGASEEFVPVDTEAIAPDVGAADRRVGRRASASTRWSRPTATATGRWSRTRPARCCAATRSASWRRGSLGADAVAAPVNVSSALERSGWFGRVRRTRIGSPFVVEAAAALAAEGGARRRLRGERRLPARRHRRARRPPARRRCRRATRWCRCWRCLPRRRRGGPLSALVASLPARATASARLEQVAGGRFPGAACAAWTRPRARAPPWRARSPARASSRSTGPTGCG